MLRIEHILLSLKQSICLGKNHDCFPQSPASIPSVLCEKAFYRALGIRSRPRECLRGIPCSVIKDASITSPLTWAIYRKALAGLVANSTIKGQRSFFRPYDEERQPTKSNCEARIGMRINSAPISETAANGNLSEPRWDPIFFLQTVGLYISERQVEYGPVLRWGALGLLKLATESYDAWQARSKPRSEHTVRTGTDDRREEA